MLDYYAVINSPIGFLKIRGDENKVTAIYFLENEEPPTDYLTPPIEQCIQELNEYFDGTRKEFTFPYSQPGTKFQKMVWQTLVEIPYGETRSYSALTAMAGFDQTSVRAVGTANGRNMMPIVVPCHRVIGADGSLTGYAGGLQRKQWLLEHEKKVIGFGGIFNS